MTVFFEYLMGLDEEREHENRGYKWGTIQGFKTVMSDNQRHCKEGVDVSVPVYSLVSSL